MKKVISITAIVLFFTVSSTAGSLFLDAGTMLSKGKYADAVKMYEKFAADNPQDRLAPAALFNAAGIQAVELNNPDAAIANYKKAAAMERGSKWKAESCRRLGDLYSQKGMNKEAFDYYSLAFKSVGESDLNTQNWLAGTAESCQKCLDANSDPAEKLKSYKMLLELLPSGNAAVNCRYQYAKSLRETGQQKQSADELNYIISYYPMTTIGQTVGTSEKDFISQFYPEINWESFSSFGRLQGMVRQGRFADIKTILDNIETSSKNEGWLLNVEFASIVNNLYLDSDFETALEKLQDFTDNNSLWKNTPETVNFETNWGNILQMLDDISENPQDIGLHSQLGFTLLRQAFYGLAEEHFLAAVKDTTNTDAYLGLGYVYLRSGQSEKAVESLEIYLKYNPNDGNTFNQVGYAYLQVNKPDEALKCFKRYRDLEPDNPNSHDSYAEALMNMGKYDEAIAEYNEALKINPDWSNALFMLGEIYRTTGDNTTALKYYQQYIEKDPQGRLAEDAQTAINSLNDTNKQ